MITHTFAVSARERYGTAYNKDKDGWNVGTPWSLNALDGITSPQIHMLKPSLPT